MTEIYRSILSNFTSGWKLELSVAFLVALTVTLSVIILGWAMNVLETGVIEFIARLSNINLSLFFCNYLTFPGVMLHELSHAVAIAVTGGKVTKIKLLEINRTGRLGHVEFQTRGPRKLRALQLAFGSCAPVLFGVYNILLLRHFVQAYDLPLWAQYIAYYLMFSIGCHMSMSREDLVNYIHGIIYIFPTIMSLSILKHICEKIMA